ncbi:hypothetical protein BO71DRAFT_1523 [Aspergillus ellipticus CBS 707.79]|uniref:Uncharacterized protein n=1 Tax=Aspergillus ellipticus CBS 707.79 TaxID=1448320 RepID=A0A319EH46_9EURO|nr:hypothetical protein BO71DRAFT_1523 [Aspergillus ellipticus CBS 707.79]
MAATWVYSIHDVHSTPIHSNPIQSIALHCIQNARPGFLLICGFLTTLPPPLPPPPPPPPPPRRVPFAPPFRELDADTPPTRRAVAIGRRTTEPTSTSFRCREGSLRSSSRCFSVAARSRSAAIWVSISTRRLNSSSVMRRSRWE